MRRADGLCMGRHLMLPRLHGATIFGFSPGPWSELTLDFALQKRHFMVPAGDKIPFAAHLYREANVVANRNLTQVVIGKNSMALPEPL